MADTSPLILWFRRDLRLSDHPALTAAVATGRPIIPVVILDEVFASHGAAPKWRWGLGVDRFAKTLSSLGSRLILRRGRAQDVLRDLVAETGATTVWWSRLYDPDSIARDRAVKAALTQDGVEAGSKSGHLIYEPWSVETKTGGFYKVYTPFWRAVPKDDVAAPLPAPGWLPAPVTWPRSDDLNDWALGAQMRRGAAIVAPYTRVGEDAAQARLGEFIDSKIARYDTGRDLVAEDGTSGLSENLTYGEISPRTCWHAGRRALEQGAPGAETFLKELVWREFAYHLVYHTPQIVSGNWRPEWDAFPWNTDDTTPEVTAWTQGRTGLQFVDAAQRQMYVTGIMHNRARMIVASYLTKHLLSHWQIGLRWFEECLIDWDPASNAMGWQWSAGSGPDATPYFRVFNPVSQLDKFDKSRRYVSRWIAEGRRSPSDEALRYFDAIPQSWNLSPTGPYPAPIVPADVGRKRALDAYQSRGF